ncbi:MAG: sulfur carrier protein ThiS [Acidobacteriaceae bacterium]
MSTPLTIQLNGQQRTLKALESPSALSIVISALELKADRIAVERNGEIAPRTTWSEAQIHTGDRLEIVHFVGGGLQ